MKKKLRSILPKRKGLAKLRPTVSSESTDDASVPRITNETVAEHREEVLSSARKYIYPLQHSKHKIVLITTGLFIVALVGFFSYTTVALYKLKSYSTFLYGVTQVIPLPVAKAGPNFVAYENYLFQLKHYIHYYQNQQKLDFNSTSGKQQLSEFKQRALTEVVNDAFVKELAKEHHVSVSDGEVNNEIAIVRDQNRLGDSDKVFEDVLKDYWGWSVDDFKRSLKQQMLAQKLLPVLDPGTVQRADQAEQQLKSGADFATVAKQYSDDIASKNNGGNYGFPIDRTDRDVPAQVTETLFKQKPGELSGVINTGYTLEIVKTISVQGDKVEAAHIVFTFKDINTYINDLKDKQKTKLYINP